MPKKRTRKLNFVNCISYDEDDSILAPLTAKKVDLYQFTPNATNFTHPADSFVIIKIKEIL